MRDAAGAVHPPGPPPPGPTPPGPSAEVLPSALAEALAAFERHLRSERSLSPHTVRAYVGDIASLLAYASLQGIDTPDRLGVTELRGWLAIQHESGAAPRRGPSLPSPTATAGWPPPRARISARRKPAVPCRTCCPGTRWPAS